MHNIKILPTGMSCSCGASTDTNTGGEAQRDAYIHARANSPANVVDFRNCSDVCKQARSDFGHPDSWHHTNCFNPPRRPETITNEEEEIK